jgi:hypothetical protein
MALFKLDLALGMQLEVGLGKQRLPTAAAKADEEHARQLWCRHFCTSAGAGFQRKLLSGILRDSARDLVVDRARHGDARASRLCGDRRVLAGIAILDAERGELRSLS